MAARTRRIFHDENTRLKIQTSQIINRLTKHVLGAVEMQPSQVTAALGLLKKTLPDLSATQHTGTVNVRNATELSDDQLANIATGRSNRASEAAESADQVH